MRTISYYPLDGSGPHLDSISPIPKRQPVEGFNAAADKNNPTNTPTMDDNGKLSYPWLKAAPGYVPGTNTVQPTTGQPDSTPPMINMTRWGAYTPDMQKPGWEPSDPELRKQFRAAGGWGNQAGGLSPYQKNLKKYGIF